MPGSRTEVQSATAQARSAATRRVLLCAIIAAALVLEVAGLRGGAVHSAAQPPFSAVRGSCEGLCAPATTVASAPCSAVAGDWTTYGGDNRRSFASPGCVVAPSTRWRYVPVPSSDHALLFVYHVVADAQHVYVQYAGEAAVVNNFTPTVTSVDAADPATGRRQWTFDQTRDWSLGTWATMVRGRLVVSDDGRWIIDPATGAKIDVNRGMDKWGDALAFPTGPVAYVTANTARADVGNLALEAFGPQLWGWNSGEQVLWRQNLFDSHGCKDDSGEAVDGLAADGATVFYAAQYTGHDNVPSGLYAFDLISGALRWFVAAVPRSRISADGGRVYGIEGSDLVARSQAAGRLLWSAPLDHPGAQAPVLAGDRVLVADAAGVHAYDTATGVPLWTAALAGAAAPLTTQTFPPQCPPAATAASAAQGDGSSAGVSTTMVAALGSQTLVVTAAGALDVLRLSDGGQLWGGIPAQARGRLHDPVIAGRTLYVMDSDGVLALAG